MSVVKTRSSTFESRVGYKTIWKRGRDCAKERRAWEGGLGEERERDDQSTSLQLKSPLTMIGDSSEQLRS